MMKRIAISMFSMMFVWSVCIGITEAQVPPKINYQGYLTDGSGTQINGAISMTFAIYDVATGGIALWSETQTVTVNDGRYSVSLGTVNPIALTEAKPYWLGVKVGSDPEMTPRKEMTGTIYDVIQGNGADSPDSVWQASSENVYRETGNVGIGTTTPRDTLEIAGKIRISNPDGTQGQIYSENWDGGNFLIRGLTKHLSFFTQKEGRIRFTDAAGIEKVSILNSGNVGIGTTNPDNKLHVKAEGESGIRLDTPNTLLRLYEDKDAPGWIRFRLYEGKGFAFRGTLRAQEIVVTNSGWADFVFDDAYTLMPLSEVEQHINTHKHLPDIPSAQEVLENGVSVGEMQAKLLQKIEELTLHLIALEKENTHLKARVSALESASQTK